MAYRALWKVAEIYQFCNKKSSHLSHFAYQLSVQPQGDSKIFINFETLQIKEDMARYLLNFRSREVPAKANRLKDLPM